MRHGGDRGPEEPVIPFAHAIAAVTAAWSTFTPPPAEVFGHYSSDRELIATYMLNDDGSREWIALATTVAHVPIVVGCRNMGQRDMFAISPDNFAVIMTASKCTLTTWEEWTNR